MNKNKNLKKTSPTDFDVLRVIKNNPDLTQRDIAKDLKLSLGKVNYILRALINKGIVKARNFTNSKNKRAYVYYLTSKGLQEKAKLTVSFFDRKSKEYDKLKAELRELEKEIKITQLDKKNNE